jgi:membrane protein implicated in regulation of membrane protease activity
MPWWAWIAAGAAFLGAELLVPTDFYLVFLGAAALAVGLLGLFGLSGPSVFQWALFGALSVGGMVAFRRRLRDRLRALPPAEPAEQDLVGAIATAQERLPPGGTGRVELRGSAWTARNAGDAPLEPGARARVERVEGLLLHVRREDAGRS